MSQHLIMGMRVVVAMSLGKYGGRTSQAKCTASVPDLCQAASVAEAQGAPGEVDVDKGDGQGTPTSHWPAGQWSGVGILI